MEWSTERIERLRSLWQDGLSASQIAEQLGGITRNAVIGKAHRLGLTGRPSPIKNRPIGLVRPRPPRRPRFEPAIQEPLRPEPLRPELQRPESLRPESLRHEPPRMVAAPPPAPGRIEPVRPVTEAESPPSPGATILTLTDRTCKWPIGDPRDADFHFCGRASADNLPYCAEHARRAYQPPARRGDHRDDAGHRQAAMRR
jgi:GcrA cell cycle regulator